MAQYIIDDIEVPNLEALNEVLFLYINMDESTGRRERISAMLDEAKVVHQRVTGVVGRVVFENYSEAKKLHFLKCHGRHMRPGELGCYLSHLAAMQVFLESDKPFCLILEDDAIVLPNATVLQTVFQPDMTEKWDFLRLQTRRKLQFLKIADVDKTHALTVNLTRSTGATAYALNRHAAEVLLKKLERIEVPYDHAFDRPQHFGLKYRHLAPDTFALASHDSTIETAKPERAKGPILIHKVVWRVKTEVGRFIWALETYLNKILWG